MELNAKMKLLKLLFLLVLRIIPTWSLGNLSMPETALDFMIVDDEEAERELSSQLQEIDERSSGWSPWSEWTPCSRSCDGGASHQIRSCKNGPCKGKHVRYKICNMQALVAFFACLAASANASWWSGPSAKIIQGPSSKTTVVGNDGSVISAVAPGGQIIHEEHPGVVAHTAPVVSYAAPVVAHHAPVVAHSAHVVAHHAPVVAHSAHVVAHQAPVVAHHGSTVVAHSAAHGSEDVVVAGPSGTITTSKHAAPVVTHHAPVVAHHTDHLAYTSHHAVPLTYAAHHAAPVAYATHHGVYAQHAPVVAHHGVHHGVHHGLYL